VEYTGHPGEYGYADLHGAVIADRFKIILAPGRNVWGFLFNYRVGLTQPGKKWILENISKGFSVLLLNVLLLNKPVANLLRKGFAARIIKVYFALKNNSYEKIQFTVFTICTPM